jgi:hypothetical protein
MAPSTVYTRFRIPIPTSGTVKAWAFKVYIDGVVGTNEDVSISLRLNDATDFGTLVAQFNAVNVEGVVSGLNQAVATTDFLAVKIACPTWVTNPTGVYVSAYIYIT